ncbi:MAG: class I SAM-dependent methyltransferase [Bacteroidetes bacterium]|nr:class I SAM-dependent methyltransferase [Bacteroidota bacterium]MBU1718805.1 class I SAM-dependent methyltransferase [Bacteroidota bacterium]
MAMIPYIQDPVRIYNNNGRTVAGFIGHSAGNMDATTVESFGKEWKKFDDFSDKDIKVAGDQYFDIASHLLSKETSVLDAGCGSGRWSAYIADKVNFIEAIDPSEAIFSASVRYQSIPNIRWTQAEINNLPFADNSFDFVMTLGVLHHIPDTFSALSSIVQKIKPGGNLLVYLYYSLDNRGGAYRFLFFLSNQFRRLISGMPLWMKHFSCDVIACLVYFPLISISRFVKFLFPRKNWFRKLPLSYYNDKNFKIARNDALDRFGTPLEKRFSRNQIHQMLSDSGLEEIVFSEHEPFWHAIAKKPNQNPDQ